MHPLISERWSPRAFDPSVELADSQLLALLEAARWAPSCANLQPARFIVGRRGDSTFKRIFDTLRPGNQSWAGNASALLIGAFVTADEKGRSIPAAEYGLGLAAENLVLQAVAEGLVAHQMAGFDPDAVRVAFDVPAKVKPFVAIAVGGHGSLDVLPADLQVREVAPRVRKPLSETVFSGTWGKPAL